MPMAAALPLRAGGGTLAVGRADREFDEYEREVFVLLLIASTSIETSPAQAGSEQAAPTSSRASRTTEAFRRDDRLRRPRAAERFGHELSLIIVDVDDFKRVNDNVRTPPR